MHKFRQPLETKFGIKPPLHRINYETLERSLQTELPTVINAPQPIWEVLGITEQEYYEQYHNQPVNENALEIEQNIMAEETKTDNVEITQEENLENGFIETNP